MEILFQCIDKQEYRIHRDICAIINKFRKQICSSDDSDKIDLYKKMPLTSLKHNPFVDECLSFTRRLKKSNLVLNPEDICFPVLTEEYIQSLTFGVYQLKQAI